MSTVNNLGDVVMLGTNPLSTADPEIKTINGQKIKINGVELDPTGGGGGGGSVAKANEFKLENPMSDTDTRAVLFQQTENATDLKISTKSGTGNGIITLEANGQTANKFQVNDSGALCTGNLATLGKIQLADPSSTFDPNEVSQFTQGGPSLTISTQQAGDINLVTEATGAQVNINPNGTNTVKVENNAVRLNAETFVNNNLRLGTAGNEASIFQPSNSKQLSLQTLTDTNINECAILVNSSGIIDLEANGTDTFVKVGIGNQNKLQVAGGEILFGAEGATNTRCIGGVKITESNTVEAKNEEAELKMSVGGTRHDLEINTSGTGTSKGQLLVNTDIEPGSTFTNIVTEANPINPSAPIVFYSEHLRLFHDALKFNQSWKRTVTINQASQAVNAETGILFVGGVNTTTSPPTVENFTQYYNGYKTKTAGGGDVLAPLIALQGTGGFLTFEFFNSGSTTEPTAPFPLPSSFTTNDQLAFPATNGRGVGSPSDATNGYLGLKIDVPFVIPKLHTLSAPVQGNIEYLDSNVSLVWNNLVGNFPFHVQVIYKPLPSANGQFNFTLKMPNLTATPFSAVNFALCYITYQPTHDLRQLD